MLSVDKMLQFIQDVPTLQLPQLVLALQHSYVAQRSKYLQLVHA